MSFLDHLFSRTSYQYNNIFDNEFVDVENEIVTFKLTNFSGKWTGFQIYNWKFDKKASNDPKSGRYYTHITKPNIGVFGFSYWKHSIFEKSKHPIYLTEGVFDAISMMNFGDSIAVLSNNPKHLNNQLSMIRCTRPIVAVCDGNSAGEKLAKYADYVIQLKDNQDANSMPDYELESLVRKTLTKIY